VGRSSTCSDDLSLFLLSVLLLREIVRAVRRSAPRAAAPGPRLCGGIRVVPWRAARNCRIPGITKVKLQVGRIKRAGRSIRPRPCSSNPTCTRTKASTARRRARITPFDTVAPRHHGGQHSARSPLPQGPTAKMCPVVDNAQPLAMVRSTLETPKPRALRLRATWQNPSSSRSPTRRHSHVGLSSHALRGRPGQPARRT